jgi:hypothetical protein
MAHAEEVVSSITLHFCLLKKRRCNKNLAIRGGYGYIMVKLVGCGPVVDCAFVNILGVEIPSKNALLLRKKIHPLFHLAHPKYQYIVLKYPSKNGVFEM